MNRLFIALNLPDDIKEEIINLRSSVITFYDEFKWEPREKYHLTLKFIGSVRDHMVENIIAKLSFIEDYKSLKCSFTKFGFFYNNDVPKILWFGINIDRNIFSLIDKLNKELTIFSIKPENRKFRPHLTLMRVKKELSEDFINS
jgi:RNA 2',3'-cyclic 3'-phosphodiesterase